MELASRSTLGLSAIRVEKGRRTPTPNNLAAMEHALEAAASSSSPRTAGAGVGLRKRWVPRLPD